MVKCKKCKTARKIELNKNLIGKNKTYRKDTELVRIMKETLLTNIPLGP